MKTSQETKRLRKSLLAWYDKEGRTLPWRIRPEDRAAGAVTDPYKIWLSEIMCQQTVVKAATPYWYKFLKLWPNVTDLAAAPLDDVLTAWAGLGYYARARNLHKCAKMVAGEFGGVFPTSEAALIKLPGIGPYTAAAIAAICWHEATNVVDGNVERVITRLRAVEAPIPKSRPEIRELASIIAAPRRPGDYAQGLMDLGSVICKPKNPKCDICPWRFACIAFKNGNPERYPVRAKKTKRPIHYGAVFYLEHGDKVLLNRRPEKGLLGGMMELPGTDWTKENPINDERWLSSAPARKNWRKGTDLVIHIFTHFELRLTVFYAEGMAKMDGQWCAQDALDTVALPSVMRKAIIAGQLLTNT